MILIQCKVLVRTNHIGDVHSRTRLQEERDHFFLVELTRHVQRSRANFVLEIDFHADVEQQFRTEDEPVLRAKVQPGTIGARGVSSSVEVNF